VTLPLAVYMDVHVPLSVTQSLRRRGLDVLTSQEDGTAQVDDQALLARATELGRVLFSQDQDFLKIAAEWQEAGRRFRGVVFARQQGVSLGGLAADLELLLTCCDPQELENRVTYLPLM
jgi:Domain of unknown function (DUF5615)